MWTLVRVLAALLPIHRPAYDLQISGGRSQALGPCTRVQDVEEVSGFRSALTAEAIWGVSQ